MIYKFRAECKEDVLALELGDEIVMVMTDPYPDVDCTYETSMSLEELRDLLRSVPDGHVMVETVALEEHYTGERIS